jgi:hypothetical protein
MACVGQLFLGSVMGIVFRHNFHEIEKNRTLNAKWLG